MIKVGSDFSGVGAFNQALTRLGIDFKEVFACDWDKYARQTFIHNYGEPKYYPKDVYEREIPSESLDIYMTSPPCQAFSLAGKRLGKDDKRGILFFNSHEFIEVNKPKYFIFENVKGLLSDDGGNTFQEWVNLLGGKSVNGLPVLFPYDDSVPYHLYWKVLNAKNHGVPQNRERVFLIGIRDDSDNNFQFPKEEHLTKKLKDVLEEGVDDKYFLSDAAINKCLKSQANENMLNENIPDKSRCIVAGYYKQPFDGQYLKVKSGTAKGYEEAKEGDSINFSVPNSETRRGRVGKQVAQTLDTACNQGVMVGDYRSDEGFRWRQDGNSPAIMAMMRDTWKENFTGQNPPIIKYNDKRLNETIEKNELPSGEVKAIDTYNKKVQDNAPTLTEPHHNTTRLWDGFKIRRLTPRECFRLMDFPDTFTWPVSDSQAYKQAGNSIVVNVLYKILKNLLK
jgi:DNA (cytosine-5)-methyltransferase 1